MIAIGRVRAARRGRAPGGCASCRSRRAGTTRVDRRVPAGPPFRSAARRATLPRRSPRGRARARRTRGSFTEACAAMPSARSSSSAPRSGRGRDDGRPRAARAREAGASMDVSPLRCATRETTCTREKKVEGSRACRRAATRATPPADGATPCPMGSPARPGSARIGSGRRPRRVTTSQWWTHAARAGQRGNGRGAKTSAWVTPVALARSRQEVRRGQRLRARAGLRGRAHATVRHREPTDVGRRLRQRPRRAGVGGSPRDYAPARPTSVAATAGRVRDGARGGI
jgi:hypothetical protein